LAWDCSCIPLLPKRNTPLLIAVGETINLSWIENPTSEQVKQWHETYISALAKLCDANKEDSYGSTKVKVMELEIWKNTGEFVHRMSHGGRAEVTIKIRVMAHYKFKRKILIEKKESTCNCCSPCSWTRLWLWLVKPMAAQVDASKKDNKKIFLNFVRFFGPWPLLC
jgi:hypothetical protein